MIRDGKSLENLVSQIEELLLPDGFLVTANRKEFSDDGKQLAEFDIEVSGKLGSTEIRWLIECRDRPSEGAAPGSWIEQLDGRRRRFFYNKVTAVSTTGFSDSAKQAAAQLGIEIRSVHEIAADDIADWFAIKHMTIQKRLTVLNEISLDIGDDVSDEKIAALKKLDLSTLGTSKNLKSTVSGQYLSPAEAFQLAVTSAEKMGHLEFPNSGNASKQISLVANYPNDEDHFVLTTEVGPVRVQKIKFEGEIRMEEVLIPASEPVEYTSDGGTLISQSVNFQMEANDQNIAIEFHKLSNTGETHLVLRSVK